jgi:hypothetical protein
MAKKAFCVGINHYPIADADLKGCLNDADGWAGLLVDHYDFASGDVTMLTDDQATKANIVDGVKALLAGASSGDVLVFTNSSHGSYIRDENDDELDQYDEVICPYDIQENVLVDDEIRALLADVANDVHVTVISDSCYSGSVTRFLLSDIVPGLGAADERRIRFLNPLYFREAAGRERSAFPILPDALGAVPNRVERYPQSSMTHVLVSGCSDSEVSYDANIGGSFHGAMSFFAQKAIADAGYALSYDDLGVQLNSLLEQARYPQHPQVEGRDENRMRQIFT